MNTNELIDTSFVPQDIDAGSWDQIEPLLNALLEREINSAAELETWLHDRSELEAAISEVAAQRYIAMTCDTEDETIKAAFLDFVENIEPRFKPVAFELDRKYIACPHRSNLDVARYGVLDRDTEMDVKLFREENVELETKLTKLGQQYSEVCGAMMVEFDGEERTMPQMAKYSQVTDRAVREASFRAVADRRLQDADQINDIYDEMIKLRAQIAVNAGYENFRDYMFDQMHRFDYTPEDCKQFHAACDKVIIPIQNRMNSDRSNALGIDPLRPWDLAVDAKGRDPLRPFEGAQALIDGAGRIFEKMDTQLGTLYKRLLAPGCLDLESRKGKAPGGYQYNRDRSREPFIFMNAAGLHRDVTTMLHEGGHAFHSMLCEKDPLLHYRHSPMEFAEVASMSMELTSLPFLNEFYSEEDANRARREQFESVIQILPWVATIDAFQHWVYTNPTHTRAERSEYWLSLLKRFGPDVDWTGLEKYQPDSWQRQLHLFDVPFYYIEYGIAQLGALQLWLQYNRSAESAIANYTKALTLGGSAPLPTLYETAGIKLAFDAEMIEPLMNEVNQELDKLPV